MVLMNPNQAFAARRDSSNHIIERYTFASVWEEAGFIAYHLREHLNIKKGDRVVLCYDKEGLQSIAALLGCMRAGVIAVLLDESPASCYPLVKSLPRLTKTINDCKAKAVLINKKVHMTRAADRFNITSKSRHLWPKTHLIIHDNVIERSVKEGGLTFDDDSISKSDLALLQYRSHEAGDIQGGSTINHNSMTYRELDSNVRSVILSLMQPNTILDDDVNARNPHEAFDISWLPQAQVSQQQIPPPVKTIVTSSWEVLSTLKTTSTKAINKICHLLLVFSAPVWLCWYVGKYFAESNHPIALVTTPISGTFHQKEANNTFHLAFYKWYDKPSCFLTSLLSFILVGVIYGSFSYYVSKHYDKHFGGIRFSRDQDNCPSSSKRLPPNVRSWRDSLTQLGELKNHHKIHPDLLIDTVESTMNEKTQEPEEASDELHMDHVYMNYFQLLWAFTFVGPFSYLLWKKATILLKCRLSLVKIGLSKKAPVDLDALVGKIVLEQSQVIHYIGRTMKVVNNELCNVADFFFPDFPYVDIEGKFQVANFLSVEIDLDSKRMVSCKMDKESLTASEALILLWYNTVITQHVKVHALGNWGVNVDKEAKDINPFLQRNSVVSVIYNYFGFTSFPTFVEEWKKEGLLSKDWDPQALTDTFVHGVKENVCQHSHITDLMPYSDFVNFITKTRAIFHHDFAKHKHLFPGVHPEGLFAGTILHSLDHELMELNLEDPLWLGIDDPRFGKMAELGRVVRVGFVPEVPGYYFNRHFKGSGHPFYEAVYAKAAKINKKMADIMETCICR